MVSHKKETIASLIESLKNGPENYVLPEEGDISNYLGVNMKKNLDETFKLSKSHMMEKIISHVGLEKCPRVLKARETHAGKSLRHEYEYILGKRVRM